MKHVIPAILCLCFFGALMATVSFEPTPREVADYYLNSTIDLVSTRNVVSSVMFDYRGFDTMIEIMILFSVSTGIAAIFYRTGLPLSSTGMGIIIKTAASWHLPFILIFSASLLALGRMSPGGGFQGGVIMATIAIIVSVVYGTGFRRGKFSLRLKHALEVTGGPAFVFIGFISLIHGANFLANRAAGYDMKVAQAITGGGTILWLDIASGLHVAGSLGYIFYVMLKSAEAKEAE